MLNKFGSETRFPLTAAFSLSAVVAAMVAVAPSAQAQACVAVPGGTPSATCQQYFGAGATFPLLLNRQFFDYYGIAIPTGSAILPGQPGALGVQPTNPPGLTPRNTNQQFNYCGTGSGNGRAIFTGVPATSATSASCSYTDIAGVLPFPTNTVGVTPLFAGTDTPLATADITNYTNTKLAGRGNPIQIPTVFGAIDLISNRNSFGSAGTTSLNITTAQLCGIFDGSVTTINGAPISVFIRSDSSGTTSALTAYLAAACPSVSGGSYYLTAGTNTFPTVAQTSTFTRANGNDGVAGRVSGVANGVGYAEASFGSPYASTALDPVTNTTNPSPLLANLENPAATVVPTFVFPTSATVNRRLTGISLTANATYPCVLTVAGVPVVPAPLPVPPASNNQAFPIISTTYTVAYTRYPSTVEAAAVRNVYNFILGNRSVPFPGANDQIAQGLGFSILNNGAFNPPTVTNQLRGSARACLTGITSP
jgi:phosphate transport system substrate-binding protein